MKLRGYESPTDRQVRVMELTKREALILIKELSERLAEVGGGLSALSVYDTWERDNYRLMFCVKEDKPTPPTPAACLPGIDE